LHRFLLHIIANRTAAIGGSRASNALHESPPFSEIHTPLLAAAVPIWRQEHAAIDAHMAGSDMNRIRTELRALS
jgi:hypothetical protein